MTEAAILGEAATARATLSLSTTGTIKATGEQSAGARWLAVTKENKTGIIAAVAAESIETASPYCRS